MEQQKKGYYNCSVDGCLNSSVNCELSFFTLPVISERRTEWLRLIHREDLIDSSCFRARVCEAHFSPNSIAINSHRKLLKRNSIPQLRLPSKNYANKGIQAIIETADANVQCYYGFQTNAQVQTPLHLLKDTHRKGKLLSVLQRRRKRLKITNNTQSEAKTLLLGGKASGEAGSTAHELSCYACGVGLSKKIYKCVECENLTMCGDCERDNLHPHHCVLRIPSRPIYNALRSVFKSLQREFNEKLSVKAGDDEDPFQLGDTGAASDADSDFQHADVESDESSSKLMIEVEVPAEKPKTKGTNLAKAESMYNTKVKATIKKSLVVKRPGNTTVTSVQAHKKLAVEKRESKTIEDETEQLKDSSESGTKVPLPVEPEIYVPCATVVVTHNTGDPLLIKEEPEDVEMLQIEHPDGDPGPSSASIVEFGSHKLKGKRR